MVASMTANAKTIAESKNKGGGKIVLTDEICSDNKNLLAYSQVANASTLLGCWLTDDNFIHIRWDDGDLRSYPYNAWVMKPLKPTL